MVDNEPALDLGTKISLSIGAVATGTLNMGVAFFSMIYYNGALGVSAAVVGYALAAALIVDALSDPIVGAWSDRTRTRWGRRHPFMYASIVPSAVLFWLFWNPPSSALASSSTAFWFLFAVVAGVRLSLTFFDVPAMALVPELTTSYDGRSDLLNYHSNVYYGSTAAVNAVMFGVFLASSDDSGSGLLNIDGYNDAGVASAILVAVAMLACAGGLHRHIPRLRRAQNEAGAAEFRFVDLLKPFRNPSLAALLGSMLISSAVYGTHAVLFTYMMGYFWGLSSNVLATYSLVAVMGTPLAFILMPLIFHGREKKNVAIGILVCGIFVDVGPVLLRLFDLMPANGTQLLAYCIYALAILQTLVVTYAAIAIGSMLAEVVEDHAVQTGEHMAGLISSSRTFSRKATSALGAMIAGWILVMIDFPTQTNVAEVPAETIFKLGLIYGPVLTALSIGSILVLFRYQISRADHASNLEQLESARSPTPPST